MAEDVNPAPFGIAPTAAPVAVEQEQTRAERARSSAYRNRFVLVYFVLAIVLGCAIGALAVGLGTSKSKSATPQAKPFVPSASGEIGAIDLAAQVEHAYRLETGHPLVDVVATRNTLQNGNLGFLRVRYQIIQPLDAAKNADSRILRTDDALQFSLCGSGTQCTIPGTPNAERGAMLRREGLELALRTFANDTSVDNVSVFLGPISAPQGSNMEGVVLYFNRHLIAQNDPRLLSRPITKILPGTGSTITPPQITRNDILMIKELTKPYLYLYRYQIVGGHDAVLDLQPANA